MDHSIPLISTSKQEADSSLKWSQIFQIILISMASFFEGQQTFIAIFTDVKPSWHCKEEEICSNSNFCDLPPNSWQWDLPARSSIVSDWSLQCSGSILSGLPASSFFIGCLIGGAVLSVIGDTFGRKKLLFFSCLTMSTASVLTGFSTNIWNYSGLRAVSGFGRAAIGSSVLVLSTESVAKEWRGRVGAVGFLFSAFGYLSLPGLAYLVRTYSWRTLYILTATPGIVYCILILFCVYESPKWQNLKNHGKIKTFSATNCDIVSILKQLAFAMLVGFGVGLVYYGTPLGLGNLNFNLYLSVALSAMLEFPSLVMTFYLGKCPKRVSLLGLTTVSGVSGILAVLFVGDCLFLHLLSFVTASTAFNLVLIYAAEIFPTSMRNSAVSMVWQALVLGGAVSPLAIAVGEGYGKILPHFLFSLVILILGCLVLFLKETLGDFHSDPDTIIVDQIDCV